MKNFYKPVLLPVYKLDKDDIIAHFALNGEKYLHKCMYCAYCVENRCTNRNLLFKVEGKQFLINDKSVACGYYITQCNFDCKICFFSCERKLK